jgi:RNA polymerase sigma-70 factor (ECF subfamily)
VLYERHAPAVFRFAWLLTASGTDAEDITQECFLVLLRKTFDPEKAQLRTWLLGITRHLCMRSNHRRQRASPVLSEPAASEESIEAAMIRGETAEAVRRAVLMLPEGQREAVFLFEFEGFSLQETAQILEIEANAVKARLHRGRERLKRSLRGLRNETRKAK